MECICETCIKVHGRDTNTPIQCPHCRKIVGCFWHERGTNHIRYCASNPQPRAWDESRCRVCGWPLAASADQGCVPGNCSMRPLPKERADGQAWEDTGKRVR